MEIKLIVIGGKHAGQELQVKGPKFFIGRAEDCHLRPRSDLVSRHHCAILVGEGYAAIRDFDSRNGTYVNGEPVKGEQPLKTGDHLKVGQLEFEVRLTVDVGGKKKPKVHSVQEAAARTVESADDDDLDLSSWLDDEDEDEGASGAEDPAAATSGAETQTVDATRADAASSKTADAPADDEPEPEKQEEKEKKPTKVVGVWEGGKKPDSASSRDAAADMLRDFFKRH